LRELRDRSGLLPGVAARTECAAGARAAGPRLERLRGRSNPHVRIKSPVQAAGETEKTVGLPTLKRSARQALKQHDFKEEIDAPRLYARTPLWKKFTTSGIDLRRKVATADARRRNRRLSAVDPNPPGRNARSPIPPGAG